MAIMRVKNALGEWVMVPSAMIGRVMKVNGKTGDVVLDAEDVGALPDDTVVPTKTSDLQNDSGFLTAHQSLAAYRTAADQNVIDAGKYVKPSGGIPASDMAIGVIPTVPTNVSSFVNDSGYLTLSSLPVYDGGVV